MSKRMIRASTVLCLCGVVTLALPGAAAEPKNNTLPYVFIGARLREPALAARALAGDSDPRRRTRPLPRHGSGSPRAGAAEPASRGRSRALPVTTLRYTVT